MKTQAKTQETSTLPQFWRDSALPFLEVRSIADGRQACYTRHAHAFFSIGAITAGQSTYWNGSTTLTVHAGTVVMMNPGVVHACNPIADQPWSYVMFYVDADWLAALQQDSECAQPGSFEPLAAVHSLSPEIYQGLLAVYKTLLDPCADRLEKLSVSVEFFTRLTQLFCPPSAVPKVANPRLECAAACIREHCTTALKLEDICAAANLSPSYLIRAFDRHYGMTPHAYLVDCRLQYAHRQLRQGQSISEVALQAGFADQAHFQRAFKKSLAATPGQYRAQF